MSSLADAPDLVGFFSYSREDDEDSGGKLSKLRERIQAELRGQLGRTKRDFRLWQDKTAIAHGELWEDRIKSAVAESVFFIPIITPTAVRSYHCKFEFESFLAREKELGRNNLVFPILYIPVPALADDRWHQDPLLAIIGSRQYEKWHNLRHLDPSSTDVALRVEKLCENICKALHQPWLSPQERQEAEARQRAEEEERRRQEKLQEEAAEEERRRQERLQEEARQRAEEERRRQEAETKRRLDEAEAEKRRQEMQRRKLEKEPAWAAKKERLHQWRGAAAVGAALVALLLVGGIWLYRTTTPADVTSPVVRPVASGGDKAKAAADAEAQRKAEEAEQQRLAAVKAEQESKAKAEAEARRKEEEAAQQARRSGAPQDDMGRFVSAVLGGTEQQWKQVFAQDGKTYSPPVLVLYRGATQASCGGVAQSGIFYCPADQKIYLDSSFFDQIATRFRGCYVSTTCQFSQAYVIAHEVGHHVQNLLGILPKVQQLQQSLGKVEANLVQLRVELQADCLAGVWAHHAEEKWRFIAPGDVEAGLRTAAAVGEEMLQRKAQGQVVSDSFTHGSAEQRQHWFNSGLQSGKVASCNTFGAASP
jgi:predicted metalloprotease